MTQEEKAKRYDEILEAVKILQEVNPSDEGIQNWINENFPELKESEDDKIKKWIKKELESKYVVDNIVNNIMADKAFAWLKKQGDQDKLIQELGEYKVKYTQEVLEKCMNNKDDERLRKITIDFLKEFADKGYENAVECIDWLEKQGEHKPADIRTTGYWNVQEVEQKPTDKVEPKFHEGDIIIHKELGGDYIHNPHKIIQVDILDKKYRLEGGLVAHFSEEDDWELVEQMPADKVEPKFKVGDVLYSPSHHLIWIYKDNEHYCACINMNYVTENVATDGLISIPNDACPATKDEQTILFARMKEAGYEWNAEKKELKKIEQTSAWCKEDEKILKSIINDLNQNVVPDKEDIDWLKSLKDRYTRKPSDEQMDGLLWVLENCAEREGASKMLSLANSIYDALKKLKR